MSTDKYPSIFSRQMEAIVYILHVCKNAWLKVQLQSYLALYLSLLDFRRQKKQLVKYILYIVFWILNELETKLNFELT